MRHNSTLLLLLAFFLAKTSAFPEGTKELMPNSSNTTRILLDPGSGRVPFALYSSRNNDGYRLYIHIEDAANERIYFGLGQQRTGNNNATQTRINWRIHPPNSPDADECSGQTPLQNTLPALPDAGFISTYAEAIAGPNILNASGYQAIECIPTHGAGDYFITFQATATRTFDFVDIVVVNTAPVPATAMPGRVFSKCWQIRNPQNGGPWFTFEGNLFILSNDGIVTKLNPNSMEGRDFAVSCNESGCYPIGPTINAQQARRSQPGPNPHTYPQFKIFLNDPDHAAYPDGVIGQLVDGSVTTESFCNSGTINFNFQTTPLNAVGTVEIVLGLSSLTPPLVDRILITNNVPGGSYTVVWDGLDGNGTQVPGGSTFPFTLRYTNGLTHMPLWDVEDNLNGFIVNLIRPVLVPPLADPAFYWDDNLVGGSQVMTPPGCTTPPATACHDWDNDWGDQKTINTWWYLVSNSTANVDVTYKISPGTLAATAPVQPASVCPGATLTFTVAADINSTQYHWVWDGGSQTTNNPTIDILFPAGAAPGLTNVTVNGINADCGDGPVTDIPVTILPVPDLTTSLSQTTCSGVPFSIALNASPAATGYTWTVDVDDCSPNIQLCPTGNNSGLNLTGNLSVTDLTQGTVAYHITPLAACNGETKILTVTVDPKPNVTSPAGPGESLCSGSTTNITLGSGLTGPSLSWAWDVGCNNILTCPLPGTSSNIVHSLELASNAIPGSVSYTITPTFGGCAGDPYIYVVDVLQLPDVQLAPFPQACLNTPAFPLTGGTPPGPGGVYTLAGSPVTIFDPAVTGPGTFPITYTYTDANNCVDSAQSSILVQSLITPSMAGDPEACVGISGVFTSDQGMSAYQWSVSPDGNVSGAGYSVTITWPAPGVKTITLTYLDPNNCTTIPATRNITVNPLPVPAVLTGNFDVCNQKSYTYTSQPGNSNYTWNVSPGNTVTFTNQTATATWNIIGLEWIEVNFTDPNGCTAVTPTRVPVMVNPTPVFSVAGAVSVCAGSSSTYQLQGVQTGDWSISSGGSIVPPMGGVNSITVQWTASTSPSQAAVTVDYLNSLGCPGTTVTTIDVQPLPVTDFTTSTPSPVCQDYPAFSYYTVTPGGAAATYQWQVTPAANAVITNSTANPAEITWKLAGITPQTAQLSLTATTSATNPACTATSNPMVITINPKPNTQLASCFDVITTTNAKPFLLKGGTPFGSSGAYYIDGALVPGALLTPSNLSAGVHTVAFTYTDANNCVATATKTLTVLPSNAGYQCLNNTFTDPRNSDPSTNKYPTTLITGNGNTRCWMLKNLNWGATLSSDQPQSDNCAVERYCEPGDNTCTSYGALYQWDELMQYGSTPGWSKGVCPPGWHVPSSQEWADLIDAYQGVGIAGGNLKFSSFNPLRQGIFYLNNVWAFTPSNNLKATMFWTSTPSGGNAVSRGINNLNPSVSIYESPRANAFPVRCVKD